MSEPVRDEEYFQRKLDELDRLFQGVTGRRLYRGVRKRPGEPPLVVFDGGTIATGYEAALLHMAQTVAARLENQARIVRILARDTAADGSGIVRRYCCADMALSAGFTCEDHPGETVWQCPDYLVAYLASHDVYGLVIHDGGESCVEITFCPWCGARLFPQRAVMEVTADGDG